MPVVSIEEFVQIDKRIDTAEEQAADNVRESLCERWEFGKLMLAERKGKQLPKGRIGELVEATGKSQAELSWRAQFAEQYPTEAEVSRALETFTSWSQVKRSLSKPAKPQGKPPSPKPHDRAVERKPTEQEAKDQAITLDWASAPLTAKKKIEAARRQIRRELERDFRTEAAQYRAECDVNVAAYKAKLHDDLVTYKAQFDAQRMWLNAARDEERRIYKLGIEVARAKGLITLDDYNVIRSCLHPDSRASATDKKLATAFDVFNDERIKVLLVREIGTPPPRRRR
jgi:hypothetical protein